MIKRRSFSGMRPYILPFTCATAIVRISPVNRGKVTRTTQDHHTPIDSTSSIPRQHHSTSFLSQRKLLHLPNWRRCYVLMTYCKFSPWMDTADPELWCGAFFLFYRLTYVMLPHSHDFGPAVQLWLQSQC